MGIGKLLLAFVAGAATTAAVGGYYLYGPRGRQHRQQIEETIGLTQKRILQRMQDMGDWSRETYNSVVDEATHDADLVRRIGQARAQRLAQRFKRRWREMRDQAENAAGQAELELAQEDEEGL